jgi:AraC-like DNA-binding protein
MATIPINPPADAIGNANVIYSGTARRHYVAPMAGSVSIKAVLRGRAMWESDHRQFVVSEGSFLLLGDGDEYSLTIDEHDPVTTFCLFFRRGYLGDAMRIAVTNETALLDDPYREAGEDLLPGLRPRTDGLQALLARMHRDHTSEEDFVSAATLLANGIAVEQRAKRNLDSAKASTRDELHRRVQHGVDFMLSHLGDPITIEDAARAACLSLFHFHRAFSAIHGTTPHQFLAQQRLALAARLLQLTSNDVTDIAAHVGYESLGSFSTRFTRQFGVSPGRYRRRI